MSVDTGPAPPWAARFRGLRVVHVVRTAMVTPGMRRITVGGEEALGMPDGPNLKLILPPRPGAALEVPLRGEKGEALWPPAERRPAIRTFTVRRYDPKIGELDIDFVLHGDEGPASAWASRARPGDPLGISVPGGREVRPADWYLLVGDHTAVPALSRILETLPADAKGRALIEVPDARDEQPLVHPSGIALRWVHRRHPAQLEEAVRALRWPDGGEPFVWVGTESEAARSIRAYVRDERKLDKRRFLVIGYWRRGMSETEYAAAHDHDRDADYHQVAKEEEHGHHEHAHGHGH